MNTTTATVKPIDLTCTTCGAEPTALCISAHGKITRKFHTSRRLEAEELSMEQSGRAARKTAEQVADKLADSRKGRKQHQQIMDDVLANSPDLQTAMGELAPTQEQMKATRGTLDSHGNITFDTPGTTDVTAEVVTAFEKLDWELGTVKDAYSKTRRAQRSPAGTVEVWQEKRQKWAATKDQLVIKTFKPGNER